MLHFNKLLNSFRPVAAVVLLTVSFGGTALAGGHSKPAAEPGDVVDVAAGAGSFNTLVAAVKAADLVDALKGEGPFTVFAPTDEAFAALPDGTLDELLKPENKEQLQSILLYHVVPGKVMSADIKGTVDAETLQGASVAVKSEGWSDSQRKVTVNGANVISADVPASNGVIHVIDAVILPPEG